MILVGDIHGNFGHLKNVIERTEEHIIIQVGDFGLGFNTTDRDLARLEDINDLLKAKSKFLYAIRGNHDNPRFWNGDYDDKFSNLILVPDYSVFHLDGRNIFFLGGAISIDRRSREEHISYWKDEGVDYNEDTLKYVMRKYGEIDIIVTHTAPAFAPPSEFNDLVHHYCKYDSTLEAELLAERYLMTRMFDIMSKAYDIKEYFYGHFHSDTHSEFYGTKFNLLGIGSVIKI